MSEPVRFETPENIELSYTVAGLGTRFVAWFVDNILMFGFLFLTFIVLIFGGVVTDSLLQTPDFGAGENGNTGVTAWFAGLFIMIWGLGSFFYYGLFELFMRGQTPGKRMSRIRVVKSDGFSLDAVSVLVRNIFRVLDHIPVLWIVPLASASGLRFGDMVAGTIVVQDQRKTLTKIRERLADRPAADAQFRFNPSALKRLRSRDISAIEQLLERWPTVTADRRVELRDRILDGITKRLQMDIPGEHERVRFLEDLLAAEYRRQNRSLG